MPSYTPKVVEPRWQRFWEDHKTFRTPDVSDRPRFYILDMFPYPSGAGLHVGHPEGYTATDILARYRRMCGFNVLHPMGWDAFGLPAEEHARKTGTHPRAETQKNIANFRRQIKMLGFSYDWDREVDTTDPAYFKWTQWIFLVLYDTWYDPAQKRGRPIAELPIPADVKKQGDAAVRAYQGGKRLAYQAEVAVNWCPELGTVLANEEVIDGKSERGGHPVVRMPLRQWLLRITDYADRLLEDLDKVDWPEPIKKQQRDWIGRSDGAEVDFSLQGPSASMYGPTTIRVFTTRPDTLYGATYMVLSPEHPLVDFISTGPHKEAVQKYKAAAATKSEMERTELAKKKTGVFTGALAVNPISGEAVPIWIADYVLASYGTGAIMAVPAHDDRDFEFAKQYNLPIRSVVLPPMEWLEKSDVFEVAQRVVQARIKAGSTQQIETLTTHEMAVLRGLGSATDERRNNILLGVENLYRKKAVLFKEAYCGEGTAFNSGPFDGLSTAEFKQSIIEQLERDGKGQRKVNTRLRDWLFSRQRYWGEPFPILHEVDAQGKPTGAIETVPLEELPLTLPELADYEPTGTTEPPLGKAKDWLQVTRNGKRYVRETNTMPQWAGSCWYYLRYIDPRNDQAFCAADKLQRWLPVDLYVGGAEHAVLHLLYARFWHKVLFDRGHVPVPEPFQRLVNQGMILGEQEYTGFFSGKKWVSAEKVEYDGDVATEREAGAKLEPLKLNEEDVEKKGAFWVHKKVPDLRIDARAFKMSKSRGNVINPDKVVEQYGADSLRLYEMFMGPLEAVKPWSMRGVEGVYRFLSRVWRLTIDDRAEETALSSTVQDVEPYHDTLHLLHRTIKRVTDDLDKMSFNTAIAAMMEFTNHLTPLPVRPKSTLRTFVLLLSPFAPHLAEELWQALGGGGGATTLAYEPWPTFDPSLLKTDEIEVPVQINGKLKARIKVGSDIDAAALESAARAAVQSHLEGKTVKKVIVAAGNKLVNLVVG